MTEGFWIFVLAVLVDLLAGDPKGWPHPVVLMGKMISTGENLLRRAVSTTRGEKLAGIALAGFIPALVYSGSWGLLWLLHEIFPLVGFLAAVWLLSSTIAIKGLAQAGMEIYHLLQQGDILQARTKLSWIVGRDTAHLDEHEITRATVETVAENIVDGITAPLFYALIGGVPLALAYRAVNTLDSMVGYKNNRYLHFGWASARLDDIVNYLPARITAGIMVIAVWLLGLDGKNSWRILRRDARKHPSPNSGLPEAVVAGGLRVRLGGTNYYGGISSHRAFLGDADNCLSAQHIGKTVHIMYLTAALFTCIGLSLLSLVGNW